MPPRGPARARLVPKTIGKPCAGNRHARFERGSCPFTDDISPCERTGSTNARFQAQRGSQESRPNPQTSRCWNRRNRCARNRRPQVSTSRRGAPIPKLQIVTVGELLAGQNSTRHHHGRRASLTSARRRRYRERRNSAAFSTRKTTSLIPDGPAADMKGRTLSMQ